jgi:two-component system LytT family response regulator
MVQGRNKEAIKTMTHLSDILRATLQRKAPEKVQFAEELRIVESYLAIQQVRFAGRLEVKVDATDEAMDGLVPCFLQPLVENAIQHGIAPKRQGGSIETCVKRVGDKLWMQVKDDGYGADSTSTKGHGIGLQNIKKRLAYFYPDSFEFRAISPASGGYEVTIQIPYERVMAMTLRTMIVDDEPLACDLLRALLAEHDDIQVIAQCQDGHDAISYLQAKPVDLLFLDVQMPGVNGFEVVEQVGLHHLPPIIFATAYHEHAVQAFDIHAVDYLTKPVNAERLALALERVREKIAAKAALLTQEQFAAVLNGLRSGEESKSYAVRFLVKDGEKEILLAVEKIDWVGAAEYYCCLHSGGRSYMLRETISDLSERMDHRRFVRIHRSAIVNLDRIGEIYREGIAQGSIRLADGQVLKMSKAGRERLLALRRI